MSDKTDAPRKLAEAQAIIDRLRVFADAAAAAPGEIQQIMRKHGLRIDNHNDPMQKLAFTIYTKLVALAEQADAYTKDQYKQPVEQAEEIERLREQNEKMACDLANLGEHLACDEPWRSFNKAIGELNLTPQQAAEKYKAAMATIAVLPKTADGVPVTPGMTVWTPVGLINGPALGVRCHTHFAICGLHSGKHLLGEVEEYYWTFYAENAYSTREAAESAKENDNG